METMTKKAKIYSMVVVIIPLLAMMLSGCAGESVRYTGFVVDELGYSIIEGTETVEVNKIIKELTNEDGTLVIPETVSFQGIEYTVTGIKPVAFYECMSLKQLYLPETLEIIGNGAFNGCTNLNSIYCAAVVPPSITEKVFEEVIFEMATLYVPYPSVYKETPEWNKFKCIEVIK